MEVEFLKIYNSMWICEMIKFVFIIYVCLEKKIYNWVFIIYEWWVLEILLNVNEINYVNVCKIYILYIFLFIYLLVFFFLKVYNIFKFY